jgi:hypothetical protein
MWQRLVTSRRETRTATREEPALLTGRRRRFRGSASTRHRHPAALQRDGGPRAATPAEQLRRVNLIECQRDQSESEAGLRRAPDSGPFPAHPSSPPLTCHQPQPLQSAIARAPPIARSEHPPSASEKPPSCVSPQTRIVVQNDELAHARTVARDRCQPSGQADSEPTGAPQNQALYRAFREMGPPSQCSKLQGCRGRRRGQGSTTPARMQTSEHGFALMRRVWTTWTGCGGRTGSGVRCAVRRLRGGLRMGAGRAAAALGACRPRRGRSFMGRERH